VHLDLQIPRAVVLDSEMGAGVIPELIELSGDASKVVSIADFAAGDHGAQVSGGGGDRRAASDHDRRPTRRHGRRLSEAAGTSASG